MLSNLCMHKNFQFSGLNCSWLQFIYLNSNFDKNIDNGILSFWKDFFEEAGITNFDFDIETEFVVKASE